MDPKSILDAIRKASPVDLFLVSFFLLPFAFEAWNRVLDDIGFDSDERLVTLIVLFVLYIIALLVTLVSTSHNKRREVAKDEILNYLARKELEMISFTGVRRYVNADYKDKFIESLINAYPGSLRRSKLKGESGIARFVEKSDT